MTRVARPEHLIPSEAPDPRLRVLFAEIDAAAEEMVAFTSDLIRIPTINPPGDWYAECAHLIGDRLRQFDFDVDYLTAEDSPQHSAAHPRVNVIGLRHGRSAHPLVHLNG